MLIRIPSDASNAKLILKGDFDDTWNDISPAELRNKVAEKLVAKALEWVGLSDKSHTKLKIRIVFYCHAC